MLLAAPLPARWLRRQARKIIRQASVALDIDVTTWHTYAIDWKAQNVCFCIDGNLVLNTPLSPVHPMGLVIWIDNQYAAFTPQGFFSYGTLPNPAAAWIEVQALTILSQG